MESFQNFRSYVWTAYGFEHTRGQVRDKILNQDSGVAYFLYALRGGGIKRLRGFAHGPDVMESAGVIAGLHRCLLLKQAHRGNQVALETLVDFWAPRYTFPTGDVWKFKEPYLALLKKQDRVTDESLTALRALDAGPPEASAVSPFSEQGSGTTVTEVNVHGKERDTTSSLSFFQHIFTAPEDPQPGPPPPQDQWQSLLEAGMKKP
ncbi:hypothetical protein DIPPA_06556 [Diplonema papillatum]|nr:hypothetical protein DIPPA_06556 [Diplonema papillatum]